MLIKIIEWRIKVQTIPIRGFWRLFGVKISFFNSTSWNSRKLDIFRRWSTLELPADGVRYDHGEFARWLEMSWRIYICVLLRLEKMLRNEARGWITSPTHWLATNTPPWVGLKYIYLRHLSFVRVSGSKDS